MIRQKAKLPNADEAARQHVLDEAPEKFHRGERHRPMLTVTRVVLPVERNPLTIKCDQAVIADRDTMGIASEIPEDGGGPAEGRLDVHDPIGAKQCVDEGVPLRRAAQMLAATGDPGRYLPSILEEYEERRLGDEFARLVKEAGRPGSGR